MILRNLDCYPWSLLFLQRKWENKIKDKKGQNTEKKNQKKPHFYIFFQKTSKMV